MLTRATRATLAATCLALASGHVQAQKTAAGSAAFRGRIPQSAQRRASARLAALDGRQHHGRTGIKRDHRKWLHRVGIGGVNATRRRALGGQRVADKRLVCMTPEWRDAIRAMPCGRPTARGLDVTIAASARLERDWPGPWVKPAGR